MKSKRERKQAKQKERTDQARKQMREGKPKMNLVHVQTRATKEQASRREDRPRRQPRFPKRKEKKRPGPMRGNPSITYVVGSVQGS